MASETKTYAVSVIQEVNVTSQDIDDIMATALEGGISHWCGKVTVSERRQGKCASDEISHYGTLVLHDIETNAKWELTLDKFLRGLELAIEQGAGIGIRTANGSLYVSDIGDGEVADVIVQLALFGKVVFS